MNSAAVRSASGPRLRITSDTSNSVVGQTSGQWVNPKNTRNGLPLRSWSVTALPFWSVRWNGPPIATGCSALLEKLIPPSRAITPRQSPSPPRKAAPTSSSRDGRAVMRPILSVSEACVDACDDHLIEHGGAVVGPQRRGRRRQQPGARREAEQHRARGGTPHA